MQKDIPIPGHIMNPKVHLHPISREISSGARPKHLRTKIPGIFQPRTKIPGIFLLQASKASRAQSPCAQPILGHPLLLPIKPNTCLRLIWSKLRRRIQVEGGNQVPILVNLVILVLGLFCSLSPT